jgi:hypothetical protein
MHQQNDVGRIRRIRMLTQLQAAASIQDLSAKMDTTLFVVALLVSLTSSFFASWLYATFCQRKGSGSQINRAFPLLGVAVTTLFICVQISLPLSLGLLGALSIIRFRTPIKEPEETGFIMMVIAGAITCATFNFKFLIILYAVGFLALYLQNRGWAWRKAADGMLVLALKDEQAQQHQSALQQCIAGESRRVSLESMTSKDGMTSLHYSFCGLKTGTAELADRLRRVTPLATVNVFYNRPG